ncbi:MAG: acyl-CoA reductase [Bacteroidetes bacterium]|nr:acyl-CoA reductase [Bacteroidota bacterium]
MSKKSLDNVFNKKLIAACILFFEKINETIDALKARNIENADSQLLTGVVKAGNVNAWFTKDQIQHATVGYKHMLSDHSVEPWLQRYSQPIAQRVAIIMAGNIPFVGFHDLLCVLLAGHYAIVKLSKDDTELMAALINHLGQNGFADRITIVDRLTEYDMVIATGSNNTARYFEHYFGNKPHIIRKNRNAVAILDGKEGPELLHQLGKDIFMYYGLGCRNVSKLFVPAGYDFSPFFEVMATYDEVLTSNKYMNNYDYHHAVFLLNSELFLTNNFLIIRESVHTASPVSVLHFEYYSNLNELSTHLNNLRDQIQCVVSNNLIAGCVMPGQAQLPAIDDYADGVDTMAFVCGEVH